VLPHKQIELKLQQAVRAVLPDLSRRSETEADAVSSTVLVRPCPDPKFGDYQTNALMALAKGLKINPRQLAGDVLAKLDVAEFCEKPEIVGAGFLNFRLKNSTIVQTLQSAARGEHLFFEKVGGDALSVSAALRRDEPRVQADQISVRRTWPSRCTSATFARRSSAIASRMC
jgi:arginyl-tRNA synthetase